ncbi:MAG: cytochrome c-type biogenesis protein [bacterium]
MAHTARLSVVRAASAAGAVALLIAALVLAADAAPPTPSLDAQARAIASRLRCPVCQNESVADSPSALAVQMRDEIRRRLGQGESPEGITAYFVSRYGQWILLDPPRRGLGWVVWLAPAAVLAAGIVIAIRFVRRNTQAKGHTV